jgi:hypothetical protein
MLNLQQYADHRKAMGLRGATHVSVLRAINNGRLSHPAVERQGKGWGINPAVADEQWAQATDPAPRGTNASQDQRPRPKAATPGAQAPAKPSRPSAPGLADDDLDTEPDADAEAVPNFNDERALHEREKRLIARMERMEKARELVYRADHEIAYNAVLLQLTTKAASAHKQIKAEIPHLTHDELTAVERVIAEIFEEVSSHTFEELPE